MDQYMKLRAVNVWKENANLTTLEMLTNSQHQTTLEIQKRQQMLKDLETFNQDQGKNFDDTFVLPIYMYVYTLLCLIQHGMSWYHNVS